MSIFLAMALVVAEQPMFAVADRKCGDVCEMLKLGPPLPALMKTEQGEKNVQIRHAGKSYLKCYKRSFRSAYPTRDAEDTAIDTASESASAQCAKERVKLDASIRRLLVMFHPEYPQTQVDREVVIWRGEYATGALLSVLTEARVRQYLRGFKTNA